MIVFSVSGVRRRSAVCLPLLFAMLGCSKSEVTSAVDNSGTPQSATQSSWTDSSEFKVAPSEGLGPLQFWMTSKEVVDLLGDPTSHENRHRMDEMRYRDLGLVLLVDSRLGLASIGCCDSMFAPLYGFSEMSSFQGKTEKEIGIGSTREEVISAYGEPKKKPNADPDAEEWLAYSELGLSFEIREDKVVRFGMRKQLSSEQKEKLLNGG